jgi:hypothetical protein
MLGGLNASLFDSSPIPGLTAMNSLSDHARQVRLMVKKGLSSDLTEFLGGFEDEEFEFSEILGLFALGFEERCGLRFEIGHEGSLIPT